MNYSNDQMYYIAVVYAYNNEYVGTCIGKNI